MVPTWVIWWSGDAAGTLVFAPIILTLLHRQVREHVMANQTFPMLTLGLGLTMATTALLGELDRLRRVDSATAQVSAFAQGFQGQLALVEADLARLAALHHQAGLSEDSFNSLATPIRVARMALNGFVRSWNGTPEEIDIYYLDLLNHRDVSNAVAQQTGVVHQSPQVIVLKNKEVVYVATHSSIDARSALNSIKNR